MVIHASSSRPSAFAVFRWRNFTLLWTAQFISTVGSGLTAIAASILVYRLTGSALSVGMMLLVTALPGLFVGLIAGVMVDRFDRKRIMIAANLICAALVCAIPFVLPFGVAWLYIVVALSSAVGQFFAPAQASLLPETAPDEELAAANAMMSISQFGALTVGYAGAGLLATLSTIAWAFYLDALSFVLSALCILLVRVAPLIVKGDTNLAAVAHNLRVGLGFVRDTPVLRSLVLVFVPIFINYGFMNSLLLPFSSWALGATEFEYSLLEGLFTVGFVVGSLVMAGLADRLHAGQWVAISILGTGLLCAAIALSQAVSVALVLEGAIGVLNAPSYIGRQLAIQRTTPRETRGRVSSVFFVIRDTGFMLGMAAAGLADLVDVRMLLLVSAVLLIGCGLLALILPGLGQPTAEWRHVLAMLRAAPVAPGLGLGRAALVADIDRLAINLPALAHMSRQERQALAAQTRVYEAPPGTAIVRQGEQSDAAYFLLDGRTVASRAENGAERVLGVHSAGDFFGEIAALTGIPRTASVLAEQPTSVLQVPAAALRKLTRDPQLNRVFLSKLTERMARMNMIELPRFAGLDQETLRELRTPDPQAVSEGQPVPRAI
jgi:CRP-like cAMP-binding protein/predicted MFS family arabinose efflux permease